MYLIQGNTRVELDHIGEGYDGDYNEDDPQDKPLLRFYVQRMVDGEWQDVDDASYCTATPATVSDATKQVMMKVIMVNVEGKTDIKRICEQLSWLELSDKEEA